MPTKCCWVIHGSLTSERKASTLLPHRRSSITRPCCSVDRSNAKLLVFTCTLKFERSTGSESERVEALGLRAVEVIICMITRDFSVISMTSQASLSLSLPLTKVTDAQYRKRFRASYKLYESYEIKFPTEISSFTVHENPRTDKQVAVAYAA